MGRTLYIFTSSPPARGVQMVAKHLGVNFETKNLDFMKAEQKSPEFLKLNPTHTVPVLVEEDGFTLWESHTILMYLADKYGKDDSLYPKDAKKRLIVHQRLFFESDIVFNRLVGVVRPFIWKTKTALNQFDRDQINEVYHFLETFLNETKWLAGDDPTIVDYITLSSVSSSDCIVKIDAKKYPKLTDWVKRINGLPGAGENKKGLEEFDNMIKSWGI